MLGRLCVDAGSGGHSSCSTRASHCGGFSCCRAWALGHAGFCSCGSWALEHRLNSCGEWRVLSSYSVWTSHCGGFSCCRAWALSEWVWLHGVLVAAYWIFSWGMWDLVPWPGIKLRPSALGAQHLSCWTTREISKDWDFGIFGTIILLTA